MKIVDFHAHPFLRQEEGAGFWPGGPGTPRGYIGELKRAGVDHLCGCVARRLGGTDFREIVELNDMAMEVRENLCGNYTPGIHIHPRFPRESCEEIERCYARGVRMVGELVPYMMDGGMYNQPGYLEPLKRAQELGMILSIHPTDPADMEALLRELPLMAVAIAHPPPDKERFLERLPLFETYRNAYMDLSGLGLFRAHMLEFTVSRIGAEKILMGTDYPACNPAMAVQGVMFERINDAAKELILGGNAIRLFGDVGLTI